MPAAARAIGACSRLDPQPKFLPPMMIVYGETNSSAGAWNGTCPFGSPACAGRHAAQGVLAEHLVLLGDRRVVRQVLGRDDLVGVDVVAQDVGLAFDHGLHVAASRKMGYR